MCMLLLVDVEVLEEGHFGKREEEGWKWKGWLGDEDGGERKGDEGGQCYLGERGA